MSTELRDNLPAELQQSVISVPHPFRRTRIHHKLKPGLTILEILWEIRDDIPRQCLPFLRVWVDGTEIDKSEWETYQPDWGSTILVRAVPTGDVGRILLGVLVMISAIVVSALTFGALAPLYGTVVATIGAGLAGATVSLVGSLIVNALVPPPISMDPSGLGGRKETQTQFIQGARNSYSPYGPIPVHFGTIRIVPPHGALPYTEILGEDQYLRCLFVWGYGPLSISDIKIGETPIEEFEGVEIETREGYDTDEPITLYTQDVYEEGLSVVLKEEDGWQTRRSQTGANELSVDIVFARGLFSVNAEGGKVNRTVRFDIEYRRVGDADWTAYAGGLTVTSRSSSAVRKGIKWSVDQGTHSYQYDVRIRRTTKDTTSVRVADEATWTALRSIKHQTPIRMPGLAMTAIRIKATDQLHGIIDELNGVVTSVLPDWTPASSGSSSDGSWVVRETNNPASHFVAMLQGPANARPLGDDRIDWEQIQYWHQYCEANGFEFCGSIDKESPLFESLKLVCSVGRAAVTNRDGLWSVVIDEERPTAVQHFTPRNSWGFSGERSYADLPHCLRCRFLNRDENWKEDEFKVYDDGYDENNASKFESVEFTGITAPEQVWKTGRYLLAVARLQREKYSFYCDVEHLACTVGDRIKVTHDVTLWGQMGGRVKSVDVDSTGDVIGVTLDETVTMIEGYNYNVRFRLTDGTSLLVGVVTEEGETNALTFTTPIAPGNPVPMVGDLAMFGLVGYESKDLLIKAIEPSDDLTAKLTCVDYDEAIYAADQGTIPEFNTGLSDLDEWLTPVVESIQSDSSVLFLDATGTVQSRIVVTFSRASSNVKDIRLLETAYRHYDVDSSWSFVTVPATSGSVSIYPVEDGGVYEIKLRFVKNDGLTGPWTPVYAHTVQGKAWPPNNVEDFTAVQSAGLVNFSWTQVSDLDLWGYEIRYGGVGVEWDNATLLTQAVAGTTFTSAAVPPGSYDFLICALDTSGNRSTTPSRSTCTVLQSYETVFSVNYGDTQSFGGWSELTNFVYHPLKNLVRPKSGILAADADWELFDEYCPEPYSYGIIQVEFAMAIDVMRLWFYSTGILGPGETGSYQPVYKVYTHIYGESSATRDYDSSGESSAWDSEYVPWTVGVIGNGIESTWVVSTRFYLDFTKGLYAIDLYRIVFDRAPQVESGTLIVEQGGTTLTFESLFYSDPVVVATAQSSSGNPRYAVYDNLTKDSVTLYVFDSSGNDVGGTVNYIVRSNIGIIF